MAIIKYRVEATVCRTNQSDERNVMGMAWQYEELYDPDKPGKLLSREKALEMIREQGLILVHSSRYGAIYDKPDEPLWEKHNGYYGRHKRKL